MGFRSKGRKSQKTGGWVGLSCLPIDLLDRIKTYLSGEDLLAFLVALKLGFEYLRCYACNRRNLAIICDPATKRLVSWRVELVNPPPRVLKVLPAFENVQVLDLDSVVGELTLRTLCPSRLREVILNRCTLQAGEVDPPKTLVDVSLRKCRILLGPAQKQWPLLSSPECSVRFLLLAECTVEDVHGTGALPVSCPSLASLHITSCTFVTARREANCFGEVSKSLTMGSLTFRPQQQRCHKAEDGAAPPLDHLSRGFLRNVVPQLTSLEMSEAARHTLCDAYRACRNLHKLETDGCCPDHQLLDIASSGSVAAHLTCLDISSRGSDQGPSPQPMDLSKFSRLESPWAEVAQPRDAARLLEACQQLERIQRVNVTVYSTFGEEDKEAVMRWDARIRLHLPSLERCRISWVFSELDLRGCCALSSLQVVGTWKLRGPGSPEAEAGEAVGRVASCVTPPTTDGHWAAARRYNPKDQQEPVAAVHWHREKTQCKCWLDNCNLGH